MRGRGLIALLTGIVLVAAAGCGPSPDTEGAAKAEYVARRLVHPEAGAHLIAAQDAYHAGQYERALALADSAAALEPDLPDVPFLRGLILTDLRRFEEAQASYERVVAMDSSYRGVWMNIGNNAFRQGQGEQALRYYLREHAAHPSPDVLLKVGYAYENLNDADSARWAYERAVAMDSTFAAGYARLGQLDSRDGSYDEALVHARQALRLEPENPNYQYFTGYLLLMTGRPEEAVPYLLRVTRARPWHYGAHYNLGQAYIKLGETERARRLLARADTLQQIDSRINQLQGRAEIYHDKPDAWVDLAEAYREIGRVEEALKAYQAASMLDPSNLQLQSNVATLALMAGRAEEAAARYERVLRHDSTLTEVWLNLGIARAAAGRIEPARQAWRTVLRHRPGHPVAERYLARYAR